MHWKNIHKDEKGYSVHLMALVGITVGVMLLVPFLGFASSALLGSEANRGKADEGYAADSGVEHALWRLVYEAGFANSMGSENPTTATPGFAETFTYTITIENVGPVSVNLKKIVDLLPPGGFTYVSGSSGGIITSDPSEKLVNGRWELTWGITPKIPISPGQIMTQTIQADATLEAGQYCNETWITVEGTSDSEVYSWPTACVTVPAAFDIEADAGGVIVRANTIIAGTSVLVRSWQIE
ncbi:MAG: DUF11 domain-containing protein [Dehalococcoidia bacterium]